MGIVYLVVIVMGLGLTVAAIQDYCAMNTLPVSGAHMQFTKEPSSEEFALVGKFKGLHCCARGYRSIEWYKDGKPYPWPAGPVSQMILYPESANQTIYTNQVKEMDSGNYTCVLKNDSMVHQFHTIQLKVFDKVPDDPKITYVSQNTRVALGDNARLFCEAFAGHVDLPDAHNEAVWRKEGQNGTLEDMEPRIRQEKISREDGQTFGTYLIIEEVRIQDYGEYVCKISKPGKSTEQRVYLGEKIPEVVYLDPNPMPFIKIVLVISAVCFLAACIVLLNFHYGLSLKVRYKDKFGYVEDNDGKDWDALILHSSKDSDLVDGVLLPTLKSKFNYQCVSKSLPLNYFMWYSHLHKDADKSRRIVAVVSPALLNDTWESNEIYEMLKQLLGFGKTKHQMAIVTLKKLPAGRRDLKNAQGETLKSLSEDLQVIEWERAKDDRFWLQLRLKLPPKRNDRGTTDDHTILGEETYSKRLNDCCDSQSFEV